MIRRSAAMSPGFCPATGRWKGVVGSIRVCWIITTDGGRLADVDELRGSPVGVNSCRLWLACRSAKHISLTEDRRLADGAP